MRAKKEESETFSYQPFEGLKKMMERKGPDMVCKPPAPTKEKPINDDELFVNAMKEVREIKEFRRIPVPQKEARLSPGEKSSDREAIRVLEEIVTGKRSMHLPDTQEYVEWTDQDCRRAIIGKLHEGKFSVQDYLDLHGMCVEEAETAVRQFLKGALFKRHRCVKIIHGRGLRSPQGPVLKDALIQWLSGRYRKHVIAFVTARQCDGGLGALYILLR
jgi:DNA-nicking Smr family endonuclease